MVELCDRKSRRKHTVVCALHEQKPRMFLSNSTDHQRLSHELLRNNKLYRTIPDSPPSLSGLRTT
jgi:hypothetical protein